MPTSDPLPHNESIVGAYKIIELNSRDTTVDTRDDLLCYLDGVDMLRV